jgi:ABC-type branched-subunit amino acid transport system substrate-binding protein
MKFLKIIIPAWIIFVLQGFILPDFQTINKDDLSVKTVKIGLLIQDQNFLAARHAADLAIEKANKTGGYKGIPFEMVELSMEGPWGTGSKQAVDLIFEKKVVAILGSNDGRNAHLVEQVSAKTRVIFVSSWSGDPTLSQAYVPWYFSCVPNDLQQSDELIKEISFRENIYKIATVSGNDYDSKLALNTFLKRLKISGKPEPKQFFYDNNEQDFSILTDQITKADINGIILFEQASAVKILEQLRLRKVKIPVFGTLSVSGYNKDEESALKSLEEAVLISSGHWFSSGGPGFRQEFLKKYGYQAGPVAAYAFDGMNLIINAIKNAGTEREEIQKYLKHKKYEGITGTISFDDKGNRIGNVMLMKIKNGIPAKGN